jgi:hypothetical protein
MGNPKAVAIDAQPKKKRIVKKILLETVLENAKKMPLDHRISLYRALKSNITEELEE